MILRKGLFLVFSLLFCISCSTPSIKLSRTGILDTREHPLPETDADIITPKPIVDEERFATYTVERGDTLFSIARAHGMTVQELQNINRLSTVTIKVGQTLLVRGAVNPPKNKETIIHNLPVR